tara:strand:+ start:1106 stop:2608 length:1503 start_codon:yes stop_codon:yes gene_type:complete
MNLGNETRLAMRTSSRFALFLITTVLSLLSETAVAETDEKQLDTDPGCFVKGFSERLNCGFVTVPENYEQPEAKQIEIHYAVIPSIQENSQPDPLLILAGGPGQAATELTPMIARIFADVRKQRDIVLIDQRGTGKSNPLSCDVNRPDELVRSDDEQALDEVAAECLAQYPDVDVTQYNTPNAIRDFERVRETLNIAQWNLYGGSYGSRVGLKYLQQAPEAVRTATLDAVAPPQVVIGPFGFNGSLAFDNMLQDCQQQKPCVQRFPNLKQQYNQVMELLAQESVLLDTEDPLSAEPIKIRLTPGRFSSVVRLALYNPATRQLLPYAISEAKTSNYKPILGLMGGTTTAVQNSIYLGLMLSVVCREDLPRATESLLQQDANNEFIGGKTAQAFVDLCKGWQTTPAPADFAEPVTSEKPILLLSGTQDPVTPPRWADIAARTLPNSLHVIAPYAGHTIAGHTCANKIVAQFVRSGSVKELDTQCVKQRKLAPFVLNANGEGL